MPAAMLYLGLPPPIEFLPTKRLSLQATLQKGLIAAKHGVGLQMVTEISLACFSAILRILETRLVVMAYALSELVNITCWYWTYQGIELGLPHPSTVTLVWNSDICATLSLRCSRRYFQQGCISDAENFHIAYSISNRCWSLIAHILVSVFPTVDHSPREANLNSCV
jgi:hypothetical protein